MQLKLTKHDILVETEKSRPMSKATVEEALTLTGFGKYNIGLLCLCGCTLQAMGMDLFGTAFVAQAAHCDLDLNMQTSALLSATPLIGVVLGAQLWGYISDTRGRRLTLIISMSVGFVFGALSSIAPDWKTMAFLKLCSSTFTSACNSAAYTLLGESCCSRVRSRAMLLCTCMLMCSQGAAAAFAYPILPLEFNYRLPFLGIDFGPWRLLVLVMALPCAATAFLLRLFHESPKFLVSRGMEEEALDVMKKIYAVNTRNSTDSFPVKKLITEEEDQQNLITGSLFKALWQQTAPLFRPPLLKVTLKLFYQVAIIYMTGSGFILWLPYIMNNMFLVLESGRGQGMNLCTIIRYSDVDSVGVNGTVQTETCTDTIQQTTLLSAMAYGAICAAANIVLSLTCGSRKRLAMMFLISSSAVAAVMINLVRVPIAGALFFFQFVMCALAMGMLSVYFVELYPTSLRGMASCISIMWGRSCAFIGVNLIGALINYDCESTFYAWAVLLMSAVLLSWFLPRDKNPMLNKQ